ncbi:hypothetical protein DFR58_14716 [Anaerobacterium chartisolvens]|uniref:Uncharacterized protein n=1 Tax=Anaerobacterium chartisolvens TaxID=1297424 RepID=A0A369AHX7_9FIRM|nr:hypothetical protein [Anaerobacterium chartisolvens]RCX07896.1 hypothetical protein DFR58_14716 [Anaerobacterium chartisolvens]
MDNRRKSAKSLLKHYITMGIDNLGSDCLSEIEGIVDDIIDAAKAELQEPQTIVTMGIREYASLTASLSSSMERIKQLNMQIQQLPEDISSEYIEETDIHKATIVMSRKAIESFMLPRVYISEDCPARDIPPENLTIQWKD